MKTIKYFTVDKSDWGEGPWLDEPDKMQWLDKKTGLPCLIVRSAHTTGALCGYVGVPPGHPFYGKSYSAADKLNVHGGLTFAAACAEGAEEDRHICHLPEPGEPTHVWWFGFDCAHAGDLSPKLEALMWKIAPDLKTKHKQEREEIFKRFGKSLRYLDETYRAIPYVRREVRRLAQQLAALA